MNYTKGKWKKIGQHIHINTSNVSDEIATVLWPKWMPESEARANAKLIAAAPDLYEALKELQVKFKVALEMAGREKDMSELIARELINSNNALSKAE